MTRTYDGGAPKGPTGDTTGDTTNPGDAGQPDVIAPDASADTDGGAADSDSGATEPEAPSGPHSDQLPTEDPGDYAAGEGEGEDDYSDAAAPAKKKKKAAGGCSTAPGGPAPTGEMFLGFGVVALAAVIRRRARATR